MDKMLMVGAIKAAADGQTFEGWASTSALDHQNDIVEPSAFRSSLRRFIENGPIYWQHEEVFNPLAMPIGKAIDARIADNGLWIVAKWANTEKAQEVRSLVLDGIVSRLSIGYIPIKQRMVNGANVISDMRLDEVSIVAIPANDDARIVAAKAWLVGHDTPRRRRRVISFLR